MAGVGILLDFIQIGVIGLHNQGVHIVIVVTVFGGFLLQHFLYLLVLRALEIIQDGFPKLRGGNLFLLKDQLLDGGQGVCHVGNAHLEAGNEVVDGSAFLDGLAPAYAVVGEGGAEDIGHVPLRGLVDGVFHDDAVAGHFPDSLVPGGQQLLIGFHVPEMAVVLGEALPGGEVHSAVHGAKQHPGEVDIAHACAAVAPFAGHCRFHAADGAVVVGVLFLHSPVNKGRNDDFVVVQGGHAEAQAHDLNALGHKVRIQVLMVAHGEVGLGQPGLGHGAQYQEGKAVYGVLFPGRLSANGDVLVHGAASGAQGVGLGANLVDGEGLNPQASQELQSLLFADSADFNVPLVVGVHVLVKAAVGKGMAVGLNLQNELDEPYRLHCFPEGGGGLVGHLGADAGHFRQLCPAGWVLFLCGHFACQLCIALGKVLHGLNNDEHGFVEDVLVNAVRGGEVKGFLELPGALFVACQALCQKALVVHRQMGITGVELALHAEDAGFHKDADFLRQQGFPAGPEVVVLPEGGQLPQGRLGLLGDVENIAVPFFELVQFLQHELHGVFREDRGVAVFGGLVPCQQALVFNVDGHVVQDVCQHQGPLHDRGLVLVFPIGLGGQHSPLGIDKGLFLQHFLPEGLHSWGQGAKVGSVFHIYNLPFE